MNKGLNKVKKQAKGSPGAGCFYPEGGVSAKASGKEGPWHMRERARSV